MVQACNLVFQNGCRVERRDHQADIDKSDEEANAQRGSVVELEKGPATPDREFVVTEFEDADKRRDNDTDQQSRRFPLFDEQRKKRHSGEDRAGEVQRECRMPLIESQCQQSMVDMAAVCLENAL